MALTSLFGMIFGRLKEDCSLHIPIYSLLRQPVYVRSLTTIGT